MVEAAPEVTDEALVAAVKDAGYEATVAYIFLSIFGGLFRS